MDTSTKFYDVVYQKPFNFIYLDRETLKGDIYTVSSIIGRYSIEGLDRQDITYLLNKYGYDNIQIGYALRGDYFIDVNRVDFVRQRGIWEVSVYFIDRTFVDVSDFSLYKRINKR